MTPLTQAITKKKYTIKQTTKKVKVLTDYKSDPSRLF